MSVKSQGILILIMSGNPDLAIFCCCTVRFVSDLVGNPEDWFSQNEAQTVLAEKNKGPDHTVWFDRLTCSSVTIGLLHI